MAGRSSVSFKRVIKLEDAFASMAALENQYAGREIQAYLNAVEGVTAHPDNETLSLKFCFAMAFGSSRYPSMVLKAGALPVLVSRIKRFPKNERLIGEALEALRNLTEMPDGAEEVLQAGAIDACLTAMRMNPEADWVMQEGCGLACRMVTECDDGRDYVLKHDGIRLIMDSMEAYPRASWIAMWGAQAMTRFAELDAKRVGDAQGFELMESTRKSKHFEKNCPVVHSATTECLKLKPPETTSY
eukprot:TRINITY_DN67816_c0_g1_i1.p1 TRINITY_DN67816_c0_g1~~TRINITY_DN67816_c0_g1_i1.p1  ORF type:complete len:244 (+),score=57.41 TRINITY_DN67816_c0_g1_i1:44-775(+)